MPKPKREFAKILSCEGRERCTSIFRANRRWSAVAGTGVTVNAVLPGPTRSEGVSEFVGKLARERGVSAETLEAEFIQQNRPSSLIRRLAEVEEVANMVVYVCSPQASATTGAALRVDGGVVRSIV